MTCRAYAIVNEYMDARNTIDVKFYTFHPYNYGKDVCVGFGWGPLCIGWNVTVRNHVGDWERIEMRLQGGSLNHGVSP